MNPNTPNYTRSAGNATSGGMSGRSGLSGVTLAVRGFVLAAPLAFAACSGGGSEEDGINTTIPDVEVPAVGDLAGSVEDPLGVIQAALASVLIDQIAANIPDEDVARFAELVSQAAIDSIEVPEALVSAAAQAQQLAQSGEMNPEAYAALLESTGLQMVADLRSTAERFAQAALSLTGGQLATPNSRDLALAATQATALANALSNPESLSDPATVLNPLNALVDAVSGLEPGDLLPEPLASAPGAADSLAGLEAVLGQFQSGLGGAQDAFGLIFGSGVPQDLTGPAQGILDQLNTLAAPLSDTIRGLIGDNAEMLTRADAATDLLFAALRAANAPDDPNTPLRLAEEGTSILASLFGDLGGILPDVLCGILPLGPACDS